MSLSAIDAVCEHCGNKFTGTPRRTFLGFQKITCPLCAERSTYPLSSGYRTIYWVLFMLMCLVVVSSLADGAFAYPGGFGIAIIFALIKDVRLKKQVKNAIKSKVSEPENGAFDVEPIVPDLRVSTNPSETLPSVAKRQDKFLEKALLEYESGNTAKSVHARAIVEADGNQAREKSAYIKLRIVDLEKSYVKYLKKKREEVRKIEVEKIMRKVEIRKSENKKEIMDKLYKRLGGIDNSIYMVNKLFRTLDFLKHSIEAEVTMLNLRDTHGKIVKSCYSFDEIIKSIEYCTAYIVCPKCNYSKSTRYDEYKKLISTTIVCPKCKSHFKIELPPEIF